MPTRSGASGTHARPLLLVATTNVGKMAEFADLLGDLPITLKSLTDFPGAPAVIEDGATYAANAQHKAITLARWSACVALADDSGLEVAALHGAPGVHAARYAGPAQDSGANVAKLLAALRGVPAGQRTARFRCVIAVASPDGAVITAEGSCEGQILEAPRGSGGFGYDPVFLFPELGRSFAEIPAAVKNRISHRARACQAIRARLLPLLSKHAPQPSGGG